MRVRAIREFEHDGRTYAPGDVLDLGIGYAIRLRRRGLVALLVPGAAVDPPPTEPPAPRPKRRYQTRHLQARD